MEISSSDGEGRTDDLREKIQKRTNEVGEEVVGGGGDDKTFVSVLNVIFNQVVDMSIASSSRRPERIPPPHLTLCRNPFLWRAYYVSPRLREELNTSRWKKWLDRGMWPYVCMARGRLCT